MSKGTVFGGVICLPQHPASDIHGLVRCVIRTKSWLHAERNLESIGVRNAFALWREGIWSISYSSIEQLVTEAQYGRLLVCPLAAAYVTASTYQPLEKQYFHPEFSSGIRKSPVIASETGTRPQNP